MHCPVCNNRDINTNINWHLNLKVKSGNVYTPIYRCNNCTSFFREIDVETFETHFYETGYTQIDNIANEIESRIPFFNYLYSLLENYLTIPNSKIIDIGCSYGLLLDLFMKKTNGFVDGGGIRGLELNDILRNKLSKRYKVYKNITDIPVNEYDIVISIDSLYYFDDVIKTLRLFNKLLKKRGGVLLFRITNRAWLLNIFHRINMHPKDICFGDAKCQISYKGMQIALKSSDFKIIDIFFNEKGKRHNSTLKKIFYCMGPLFSQIIKYPVSPGIICICRKI